MFFIILFIYYAVTKAFYYVQTFAELGFEKFFIQFDIITHNLNKITCIYNSYRDKSPTKNEK